jgi:hypothetical protein
MYQFKTYANDRDELAWEWWSWYGDRDGLRKRIRQLDRALAPRINRGRSPTLARPLRIPTRPGNPSGPKRRLLLTPSCTGKTAGWKSTWPGTQWRPDSVLWYLTSSTKDDAADAVGRVYWCRSAQ